MSSTELPQLAAALDSCGFTGRDAAVRQVVRAARLAGLGGVAVDILADPAEPEVARLRAFGHVATALAGRPRADGRGGVVTAA